MTYIAPTKAFAHLDRLNAWKKGIRAFPVTVEWDLSNRCVLGCRDCHFAHTHVRGPWAMKPRSLPMAYDSTGDLADAELVKTALLDMHLVGVKAVVWSGGGEPTTHPLCLSILEHAQKLGFQQGMYTLGGLLTEAYAQRLAAALSWVVISLDAVNGETYAAEKGVPAERFDDVLFGIKALVAARGAAVGVSFLLHRDNWMQCDAMLTLARDLGATYVTFRPAIRTSPANPSECYDDRNWISCALPYLQDMADDPFVEIDVDRFIDYRDWRSHGYETCHGVKLTATITPDGRVWICPQRRGVTPLGDLRLDTFQEIWARHPGRYQVDDGCRVMCRLHLMNQQLAPVFKTYQHEAFL